MCLLRRRRSCLAGGRQQRQGRFPAHPAAPCFKRCSDPSLQRSPDPVLMWDLISSSPRTGQEQDQCCRGWTHGLLKLLSNRDTGHGHTKAEERLSSCHFNTLVNQSRWKPYALLGSIHLVARETSFPFKMAGKSLQKTCF